MDTPQIEQFLATLGITSSSDNGNGWHTSSCPLACFTHKNGKDSHPSFGITIVPGGHSNFNCYTCHSGTLETLIGIIEMHLKTRPEFKDRFDLKAARLVLDNEEIVVQALPPYEEFTPGKQAEFEEWPTWAIEGFPVVLHVQGLASMHQTAAYDYLRMRGVPDSVILTQDLRWDAKREMIVAPYRNVFGKLAGARGRCINPHRLLKHFDYTWNDINNADLVWYGEEVMANLDGPLIVVEGQFDRMKVQQVYPKVVAGLSAKVTPFKMKRLASNDQVLFMLDNDEPGRLATAKMMAYLDARDVQTGIIAYPEQYKDPDSVPLSELAELLESLTNG